MDAVLKYESFGRVAHMLGGWKIKLQHGLDVAFTEFRDYYNQRGIQTSQKHFTVNMLSLAKQSLSKGWPMLKCKAWNAVLILHWLMEHCTSHHNGSDEHEERFGTMWGWSQIFHIFEHADPMWLTDVQVSQISEFSVLALAGYNSMSNRAVKDKKSRFPMRPKLHQCWHCFQWVRTYKRNGFSMWCMSDESVAGQLARMAARTHASSVHRRVLERWIVFEFSQVLQVLDDDGDDDDE